MRASFADTAVRDGLSRPSILWLRKLFELVGGLEAASSATAVAHGMFCAPGMWPPRCAPSCGGFPVRAARRLFLRRADIDDLLAARNHLVEHVVAKGADGCVGSAGAVLALCVARPVVGQPAFLGDPLRAATVHELHVFVAVVLQEPEEPRREPVAVIAIRDDRRSGVDATLDSSSSRCFFSKRSRTGVCCRSSSS